MTAVHICRERLSDRQRGALVFAGDLVIFPGLDTLKGFRDRIDELVRSRFGATDPESAQFALDRVDYLEAVRALQQSVRGDAIASERLRRALAETGLFTAATYWDWIHLRVLPHGPEHAGEGTGWHRDTWASNLYAQTNWWTPIYPITTARTIALAPTYWSEPIPNTSQWWKPGRRVERQDGRANGPTTPVVPRPLHALPAVPELRVVIEPGDLLCFSGAQLHRTVINDSGRARFSVEVRTIHAADITSGRGAPNRDGHASRARYGWFHHLHTGAVLSAPSDPP